MQTTKMTCPQCRGAFVVADPVPTGKRIYCQMCGAAFVIQTGEMPGKPQASRGQPVWPAGAGASAGLPPKLGILVPSPSAANSPASRHPPIAAQHQTRPRKSDRRGSPFWIVLGTLAVGLVILGAVAVVVAVLDYKAGVKQSQGTEPRGTKDDSGPMEVADVKGNQRNHDPDLKTQPEVQKLPDAAEAPPKEKADPALEKKLELPADKKLDPSPEKKLELPPPEKVEVAKESPPPKKRDKHGVTPEQQKTIDDAIRRGVKFLKEDFPPNGSWPRNNYQIGTTALFGLTLLQCDVPAADPMIVQCANLVRQGILQCPTTYEIGLSILFLDKLGDKGDKALIRALAIRLVAGQSTNGGWTYFSRIQSDLEALDLLATLRNNRGVAPLLGDTNPKRPDDNSNTQFAMLGLWAARRHDIPVESPLSLVAQRFCASQLKNGAWSYHFNEGEDKPRPAMSCVGLLGLALAKGAAAELIKEGIKVKNPKVPGLLPPGIDDHIAKGLSALDLDKYSFDGASWPANLSLYFLWSVERVGVLYDVDKIQGRDWYQWGVGILLPTQQKDGSWRTSSFEGSNQTLDTCMALLFLKRANLVQDLTDLNLFTGITAPGGGP